MFGFSEEKRSPLYCEQISNNEVEKFGDLKQLVLEDKLPKINGKINILELGVGGGDTMRKLKDQLHSKSNVNIIGLDNALMFSDYFRKNIKAEAVVADAGSIPIKENFMSAINASAVLHEVSSYGVNNEDNEKIFGSSAVEQSLNEIKRCLIEDGVLMYRDVSCPENRLNIKTVNYNERSWQMFIDLYLPSLQGASRKVSPEIFKGYSVKENEGCKQITATAQVHREIQRHYITFRDYFRKKVFSEIGVNIIREDWEEKEKGIKQHSIELSGIALEHYINKRKQGAHEPGVNKLSLIMLSDEYDDFTDEMIKIGLEKGVSDFQEEWFRREGGEIYTYLTSKEIIELAKGNNASNKDKGTLVAESEKMIPRDYYQRYLNRIIANPEFKGKQTINFLKKYYDK